MTCSEEPDAGNPHVRFCEGESQQWPIYSTSSLPDGEYRVRVRAIDAAGLDGEESEVGFLLDARRLPPVAVMPPPEGTVRTTAVNFEWSTPPQVSGYHSLPAMESEAKAGRPQ